MTSFSEELIASGFATYGTILGCTPEEVAQVEHLAPVGFPIPEHYRAFLEVMGKGAGSLFVGTELFYPSILETKEAAEDIANEVLTLENKFFVGDHQGYRVYFFEAGSAVVYGYQENSAEIERLADNFLDFLRNGWRLQKRIREDTAAIRARRLGAEPSR